MQDFLGVPGSSAENCSLALLKQHGFPSTKTLGAGVVDGRSVWADQAGEFPQAGLFVVQRFLRTLHLLESVCLTSK